MFKVGDRVMRINSNFCQRMRIGVVAIVNKVADNGEWIGLDGYPWFEDTAPYATNQYKKIGGNTMTKADLKDGMVVEHENGEKSVVLNGRLMNESGWRSINMSELKNDLTVTDRIIAGMNITKIYNSNGITLEEIFTDDNLTLIWQRDEVVEMTMTEINEFMMKYEGKTVKVVE